MGDREKSVVADVAEYLGSIFRYMLPGILVVASARLAYPDWFPAGLVDSWQRIVVVGALTVAVGNAWVALNRYGVHQACDWLLWRLRLEAPARSDKSRSYVDDLGQYAAKSLRLPELERPQRHVAFRASIVLLILTVGELAILFGALHSDTSCLAGWGIHLILGGLLTSAVGVWQMIISRRIDHYVVKGGIP